MQGKGRLPLLLPYPREILPFGFWRNHSFVGVEARNRKRRKVNGIEPIIHRQQADGFPDQSFAQKHMLVLPGKCTSLHYTPHQQGAAVFRFRHTRRVLARRSCVHRTGSLHLQRFVRTLLIVLAAKAIKGSLLCPPVGRRRRSRFLLQSAMHALVPSVLFRMSRRNSLRHNPQLHPPHRQARKPRHRSRRKRRTVVGADRPRQTTFPKRRFEDRPHPLVVGLLHSLAAQQVAAARIGDRQRINPLAISGTKPAFEIGAPHPVRSVGRSKRLRVRWCAPPLLAYNHQPFPRYHLSDRARRWPLPPPAPPALARVSTFAAPNSCALAANRAPPPRSLPAFGWDVVAGPVPILAALPALPAGTAAASNNRSPA